MIKRFGPVRGLAVDLVPALMMGGAVATLCLLAPVELLERAVVRSGLDLVVTLARPPLGLKARVLAAGGGFVVTAILVYLAMRLAGRVLAGSASEAAPRPLRPHAEVEDVPVAEPVRIGRPLPVHAASELPDGLFTAPDFVERAEPALAATLHPAPIAPQPEPAAGSISDLLARLETGLGAR